MLHDRILYFCFSHRRELQGEQDRGGLLTRLLQVRISDAEYRKQKEKAKAAGLTVSESLRQQAIGLNATSERPTRCRFDVQRAGE